MRSNIAVLPQRRENRILKRGDIYYADLCGLEQSLGSEQTGRRPVLIIQNDVGNFVEIEYQNASRREAIEFLKKMKIEAILQDKYGDIIKERLKKDKVFKENFTESLSNYKKKLM